MKSLIRYTSAVTPSLLGLVAEEAEYVFLADALEGEEAEIFSDGKSAIICSPSDSAPVWAWSDGAASDKTVSAIAEIIRRRFPLDRYDLVTDEELAERLRRADEYFGEMQVGRELIACVLDELRLDGYRMGRGRCAIAVYTQRDTLAKMWQTAAKEMEGYDFPIEKCRENAEILIDDNRYFVWLDESGEIVSGVTVNYVGKFANIATLYTPKEHRRQGYAMNLICCVADMLIGEGYTPMLYTYSDNTAAIECYKKLGFYPVGRLIKFTKR